jgi:hypothetical protein
MLWRLPVRHAECEAIPSVGGAPHARPGIWIGCGAGCRRFGLRRPGRWVDRRGARYRADHPRPRRNRAPAVPRGRTERGAGAGEGGEPATAACYRRRAAASASPLAAPARLSTRCAWLLAIVALFGPDRCMLGSRPRDAAACRGGALVRDRVTRRPSHSTIFQKESLRLILPSVNSNRSHPRTSMEPPVAWVPRIVHSDTPRSPHVQWRSWL